MFNASVGHIDRLRNSFNQPSRKRLDGSVPKDYKLYLVVKHDDTDLDTVFAALSHAARRETLDMLGRGACSVSDLAAPHRMSLAGFMKHVRALEDAGLIACAKEGRTVTCALARRPLKRASEWMSSREQLWNTRLDALGRHLHQREETSPTPKRRR